MIYSIRGAIGAIVVIGGISGYSALDRGMNYQAAKASVVTIDRLCDITETTQEPDGARVAKATTGSCSAVEEWEAVKETRHKAVSGTATIHVTYLAPQDGSQHFAELKFTGRDDEFYELDAGDEIEVLVSNEDPSKIRRS